MSEHQAQVNLFNWAKLEERRLPKLKKMFAIPNGGKRKSGWWEKTEGLKSGVLDILLPVKTASHSGLFIEMKWGKNKLTANQKVWKEWFEEEGFATAVCYEWYEARDVILKYLK